ncbi:MAG: hypothetical protein KDC28_17120, partial [Saprospiraceae bacterium]|nr:hypothetical protein [Saprospiraceae bacterium]
MERIFTPFYRGIWMCILLVTAHASIEAQNFPFTLPELPAGKSIRIYYRVNTNGTFSPVNATSISEQALIGFTGGTQNSDDPNTPAANDPTLTPAFAFDCTDFGSTVYVDSSATPGGDGTSWATAFNDLQAGLVVAQMCPRVDSVLVAKGTYYPSVSDRNAFFNIPDSSVVLGGFPSGGSPLADRMPECNPTILSGDINMSGDSTGNSYHVVKTINYLGTIYVDGFIIEAGNTVADMDDGAGWWDGSIHSTGILDINHVIFRNNIGVRGAAFYGEGLRKLNLVNSIFEYNTATDRGGAVYFTPASVLGPPVPVVLFENNLFHHNTATINGGAIALTFTPGIDFSIINNTIADNSPDAFNNNSGGNVVVGNTIFWNNGMSDITGAVIPTVTYSLVNNVPHPTNTSGDPLFGVNYRPGLGSFLTIDRGSNAFSSQATDLIGFPRINISIIDMGVYEVQTFLCLDSTIYVGNDVFKWPVDSIYVGGFAPGTVQLVNGVPGIDTLYFDCSMLGDSVILISIVDTSCGKNSPEFGCMFTATVRDGSAPMAMCKDLTVNLYSTMTTIASRDLDNGSTDNCGVVSWVASDTVFDCMDVGTQMISLTVSDAGGNTSICTSMVTVVDDKAPVPSCANGPTFNLMPGMPDPSVTITVDDILTSPVTDNCGVDTVYLSQSVFTCTDLGQKLITLTAVDVNGNSDFCLTYVTIADPMILCCDTPSITCPADILVTADPFACEVKISYPDPTVMSNCTPVITQLSGPASDSILDFGMYTVQFEASNGPTKNDTCSFTITVLENGQSQPLQSTAKRAAAGLACHDHVNISLSSDCMREITARDVLVTGSAGCIDRYNCEVFKPGSLIPIPGATLTYEHVGQTLTYVVEDVQDGGKCWGTLKLEDKLGPVIRCENDTLTCLEAAIRSTDDYFESLVSDCGPYPVQVDIVNSIWEDFQCEDSLFSGKITRTIRSSDPWGNHNECVQEIWIERIRIDSLICPDTIEFECTTLELLKVIYGDNLDSIIHVPGVTLDFEALDPLTLQIAGLLLGYHDVLTFPEVKTMDGGTSPLWLSDYYYQLFPGLANAHCNAFAEYEDQVFEVCGNARKIRRTWTIYDWCDHRDTTCEQWIIVRDTTPPLFNIFPYLTGIIGDDMEMDTTTLLGLLDPFNVLAYTEPHDCKAHVHLPDLKKYFFDCSPFEMGYEVEVADPHHPGKTTVLSGTLPDDIYLPEGVFTVKFRLVDACWNTSYEAFPEDAFGGIGIFSNFFNTLIPGITVQVLDATPPTPVCDEITQVTLDPASCWARINAEDLDDGSHDNCCDQLYYAVALKDSVDYYEAKFQDFLSSVTEEYLGVDLTLDGLGLYEGKAPNLVSFMRVAHEVWMNLCAFDVVEDLTECGEDQVVLRVYEACGLRPYDEHIKKNVTCILPPIYQTTPGGTPTAVYQWTIDT